MSRVVGIDLSLTSTGIATIEGGSIEVGRIKSKGLATASLAQRHDRLHRLRRQVWDYANGADLVVIEGPAFSRSNPGMHDRSGLWWLVVDWLHASADLPLDLAPWPAPAVVEIPPTSRAKYATGKGNAGKDEVLAAVVRRYPNAPVGGNDEADALILAAMGARHLGEEIDDLPKAHLTAMDKVRWPERSAL